jgi:tetratricopeptide (TPR) repeat protein
MSPKKVREVDLDEAISTIAKAVRSREIAKALTLIEANIDALQSSRSVNNRIKLLAYCAWAIHYDASYLDIVETSLAQFKQSPASDLPFCVLAHLNLAEALVRFHREDYEDAENGFEQLKADADRIGDSELSAVSRYYLSRTLRKKAKYSEALELILQAKEIDSAAGNRARVASMGLSEGWLYFELNDVEKAQEILNHARNSLGRHWFDRGGALSFQGRIHRKEHQYSEALDCFTQAIEFYAKQKLPRRNVARAYRNRAVVYRLLARDLLKVPYPQSERAEINERITELREKAFADLEQARKLYDQLDPNRHTYELGIIHLSRAEIYFDAFELDQAEMEAETAYEYGKTKNSKIVMAEARVIQSNQARNRGGRDNERKAYQLAKEAIEIAKGIERHQRLLARAYIAKGNALLVSTYNDPIRAHRCWEKARLNLCPEDKDYLRDLLDALEERINSQRSSASVVFTWTKNDLAPLTELTGTFQEIVIYTTWLDLNRNTAQTAIALGTQRRKVIQATSLYCITEKVLTQLKGEKVSVEVLDKLASIRNREIRGRATFIILLKKTIGPKFRVSKVLKHTKPVPS